MKDDQPRLVTVEISGQRYRIRTHLDPTYVAELAGYVERKMQLAVRESAVGDTLKIAVLAALNIADECFRARAEGSARGTDFSERALQLERLLDMALAGDGAAGRPGDPPLARTAGSH